jgi:hypothetical protein
MSARKSLRSRSKYLDALLIGCIGCIGCLLLLGCGGGSSGGGGNGEEDPSPTTEAEWYKSTISTVDYDIVSVHLVAQPEGDDTIHLAYYANSGDETYYGGIQYAKAMLSGNEATVVDSYTNVKMIDNSAALDLALDNQGQPLILYRGGSGRTFCQGEQASVSVTKPGSTGWEEYDAAIGYVERNPAPVLQDGKSGTESTIVIDSSGNAHILFTFRYEGCETINHNYPDLRYVQVDSRNPVSEPEDEETVHGNIFPSFNVVEENNKVGFFCDVVLDNQERPLAFYSEEDNEGIVATSNGLHMAWREGTPPEWRYEWVEELEDYETVKAISAAVSPLDGTIGVAYAVETEEDELSYIMLKYAYRDTDGSWHPVVVDQTASVGTYCSLAFSPEGDPVIAYHAIQSHSGYDLYDLKLAWGKTSGWELETVAQAGVVGTNNTLWIDADGAPNIVTLKVNSIDNEMTNEILYYVKR